MCCSATARPKARFPWRSPLSDRFERVERALSSATGRRFTGAVARIESAGNAVFERAYGTTRLDGDVRPVYVDSRFDLASITKLFVATIALQLVAEGALALDEPLSRVFAEWKGTPHAPITLRMLLAHTSGMNSGADYRTILGENVERFALTRPLAASPGAGVIYSDLGFIALGSAIERVCGRSLEAIARDAFDRPTLGFRPRGAERALIPATEDDGWRGRVQGFVHDEKAYLMGGVAGHAGLFGTAADAAWLAQRYLDAARGREQSLLPQRIARDAVREHASDPVLRRGLGWALRTSDQNSCGRLFGSESFGHTGFVGTCVWADPQRDLTGVLLTNSVYFGRSDTRELRAAFFEAAVEDLEGAYL
jgi:CubicO group peptidase (beta-lactamase class C family)